MQVTPKIAITRFEQLQPGDLFVLMGHSSPCFALKTAQSSKGDKNEMVLLGPDFPHEIKEAVIVPWAASTVVSYGQDYTLLLPTTPSAWLDDADTRTPVCLALADDDIFICANGGDSEFRFFQCFVNMKTGEIVERSVSGVRVLTRSWEVAVNAPGNLPRSLLKFPLS